MWPSTLWLIMSAFAAASSEAGEAASRSQIAALLAKVEQVPVDIVSGVDRPLDLRGYRFPANYRELYPDFPPTSYDLAFGPRHVIDAFVRDRIAEWLLRSKVEILDGAQVSLYGTAPVIAVARQVRSSTSLFVPLPDGGLALADYDHTTTLVALRKVYDSQGLPLPPGNGDFKAYFARYPSLNFGEGASGQWGLQHLHDWATRNGISMLRGKPWRIGEFTNCVAGFEGTAMSLTCRMPQQTAPLNARPDSPTP